MQVNKAKKKRKKKTKTKTTGTKPKLVLLPTIRQANKSRDRLFGKGTSTLFRQPADREEGELVFQGTMLLKLEFRLLFKKKKKKEEEVLFVVANFLGVIILCSLHLSR